MPKNTREEILKAAESIILEKSFHSVGINEILKAVGVPKGSFYHYFQSKEDFGVKLIEYTAQHYGAILDEQLSTQADTAADKLLNFFDFHVDFFTKNECKIYCLVVKLSGEVGVMSDSMREAMAVAADSWTSKYKNIVQEGHKDGSIPLSLDADVFSYFLYISWLGAITQVSIVKSPKPFGILMQTIDNLLK